MIKYKHFVLWGSAGHAKVLAEVIELRGGRVVALFDNKLEAVSCLPGVPLFHGAAGFREWLAGQMRVEGVGAAVAIGGARGQERQELVQQLESSGLNFPSIIHPSAVVSKTAKFGHGCQILANAVIAPDVSMGSACIVNNSANIDHECKFGSGVHIAPGAILCGCVIVGDNAMIGAGAVVLPRLRIGNGALIGAGAVVTRNVPDGAVVRGNPAKVRSSK